MPEITVEIPLEMLIPPAPPAERPAPMEYTGPLCRCGNAHCAGTDAERAHAKAVHAYDYNQMLGRMADAMAAQIQRDILDG